jgi:hypothetical protein
MRVAAATLAFFVFMLAIPVRSNQRLSMKLTPPAAVAPASLTVRTTIESSPDNRFLRVVLNSGDYFRSSEIELDGEHARRIEDWAFKGLPAGRYEITATLMSASGPRATASSWFQASGSIDR